MNWNHFIQDSTKGIWTLLLLAFPYNMLGCGPDLNPYDYYTSFFRSGLPENKSLRPFYYTNFRFLYDTQEPVPVREATSGDWIRYCGPQVDRKSALEFVCQYAYSDLSALYYHLEQGQPLHIPDTVKRNPMTEWFIRSRDLEALGYLMYAKRVEPFVTGDADWETPKRDSVKMAGLIKNGIQLHKAAKNEFIRFRYGYQVLRLYHYSNRFPECIRWYDEKLANNPSQCIIQQLCLSLKAGAIGRTGNREEAAYLFSRLFAENDLKRISNYLSFRFMHKAGTDREAYLKYCRNSSERADLIALLALSEEGPQINRIREIFSMSPRSALLELLAVREINRIEDLWYTPRLQQQQGGSVFFTDYRETGSGVHNYLVADIRSLAELYTQISGHAATKNPGLFSTGSAYLSLMAGDFSQAEKTLAGAEKMKANAEFKDQWQLTKLLLVLNQTGKIDRAAEERILPSLRWLNGKAKTEGRDELNYYEAGPWKQFYRNLLNEVIAKKYHTQGDWHKEALAIGAAEKYFWLPNNEEEEEYYPYYGIFETNALHFVRNRLNIGQAEKLLGLIESGSLNGFESFLVHNNTLKADDIRDFIATAYIRENDLLMAENWLKKIPSAFYKQDPYKTYLAANPFASLLLDTHAPTRQDTVTYTKLAFVRKMKQLETLAKGTATNNEERARASFQLANGYYHMSYWGNSWMMVQYEWHGGEGLKKDTMMKPWEKEYYGVYRAENCYTLAESLSSDPDFKARCLFFAAKCRQKQHVYPQYAWFGNYDLYEKSLKEYEHSIRENREYFSRMKNQYGSTAFYKEAMSTCSYLKDFSTKK